MSRLLTRRIPDTADGWAWWLGHAGVWVSDRRPELPADAAEAMEREAGDGVRVIVRPRARSYRYQGDEYSTLNAAAEAAWEAEAPQPEAVAVEADVAAEPTPEPTDPFGLPADPPELTVWQSARQVGELVAVAAVVLLLLVGAASVAWSVLR